MLAVVAGETRRHCAYNETRFIVTASGSCIACLKVERTVDSGKIRKYLHSDLGAVADRRLCSQCQKVPRMGTTEVKYYHTVERQSPTMKRKLVKWGGIVSEKARNRQAITRTVEFAALMDVKPSKNFEVKSLLSKRNQQ